MLQDSDDARQIEPDFGAAHDAPAGCILVPVDGGAGSVPSIAVARAAVQLWAAPIHVLGIVDSPERTRTLYDALQAQPDILAGLVVDSLVGEPAEVIAQVAARTRPSLIVMAAHAWMSDGDLPMGPVAEMILRDTRYPLLLVRQEAGERFVAKGSRFARILVPLDGTPSPARAIKDFALRAAAAGATLDVLHVVGPHTGASEEVGSLTFPRYLDQPYHEWQAWQHELLRRSFGLRGLPATDVHVAVGDPGSEIVRAARNEESDLVLLAWKGAVDAGRAQTIRTVLREHPCPVMILRAPPAVRQPQSRGGRQRSGPSPAS